ncbi:MAG: helix-turn-helix domain-containing protein [bacterium]|nr:helix-turn-helix domain-containing protein [bacterium]
MTKTDARSMEPKTQEQLREQAIRLWHKGKKYAEIADIVGVSENTVGKHTQVTPVSTFSSSHTERNVIP